LTPPTLAGYETKQIHTNTVPVGGFDPFEKISQLRLLFPIHGKMFQTNQSKSKSTCNEGDYKVNSKTEEHTVCGEPS